MPAVIGGSGIIRWMEVPLTGEEQLRLDTRADTIRQTIRSVGF